MMPVAILGGQLGDCSALFPVVACLLACLLWPSQSAVIGGRKEVRELPDCATSLPSLFFLGARLLDGRLHWGIRSPKRDGWTWAFFTWMVKR
ncbi:hypothetical protein B0H67DRAFT_235005 [Lasiosphaeris hirsuta]|uniref:Uncharacterized protein n=1 Tax=Lasiosphaeris hirsuta TaxID=260670 RepID=A0AA40AFY3_9PEZI|nr:hypothetical protein B0H67DRAFT_235005 [Lasiosphaeris hirsuta]